MRSDGDFTAQDVVEEVSALDPFAQDESGAPYCFFCRRTADPDAGQNWKDRFRHEYDCTWTRARSLDPNRWSR